MSHEKLGINKDVRHWLHTIEQGYRYTAGPIGSKFLEGLRSGKLLAGKCSVCGRLLIPPKAFCQYDFGEVKELVEVAPVGTLRTFTVVYEDSYGNKLPNPVIIGFITFPNTVGGIVHYIINAKPERLRIGMLVRPVFKPEGERRGSLTDIVGFEPA
ncbi:Zn-ribbon domain-containing OB-fold protein [Vulcanisaeta thermophila]|uniref:Zn-ribbon domain-containing OB-fold protein n=1 Tax=Vulcanisaeta thermophila TaxID=867917 RepID=UPI0008535417|nr:Zn-ribbon domain-containing OB-fold protein [Vulcanisaeta thermophila]